jgi:hypothetical protein
MASALSASGSPFVLAGAAGLLDRFAAGRLTAGLSVVGGFVADFVVVAAAFFSGLDAAVGAALGAGAFAVVVVVAAFVAGFALVACLAAAAFFVAAAFVVRFALVGASSGAGPSSAAPRFRVVVPATLNSFRQPPRPAH